MSSFTLEPRVTEAQPTHANKTRLWMMVLLALALRLVAVGFLYKDAYDPRLDFWRFGWETGRIARSLAQGSGFSNPLPVPTGPTAWIAPLYPGLLAGVFKLFGIYSAMSAVAILGLNSVFSALTCVPVYFIAQRSFGEKAARWSGWMWAVFPYAIYWAAGRVWENCLTTLLMTLLFWMTLRIEEHSSLRKWAGYGALWGAAALSSPSVLATLPFLAGWLGWRVWRRGDMFAAQAALGAIVFAAMLAPWLARNARIFVHPVFLRDNLWLELRIGNTGDTSDVYPDWSHPTTNPDELAEVRRVGELAYMQEKKHQALDFISRYPGEFLYLTFRRFLMIWTGLWSLSREYLAKEPLQMPNVFFCSTVTVIMVMGLRRAWSSSRQMTIPYVLLLFSFPLVYYVTHAASDYRHPIDPEIVILAVYGMIKK